MSSSISLTELEKLVEQVISEQKWGKKQGRDYSKEKKTAGIVTGKRYVYR